MDESKTIAHRSPPLGPVAVVFFVVFAANVAAYLTLTHGAPYPTPYRPIGELADHYARFPAAAQVSSLLLFGSAMPFCVYVATAASRLSFLRIDVAGVHIALVGGAAAGVFLAASALPLWALSQPGVAADAGAMRAMQLLAFALGGFAHTVALGLLMAGLSVPSLAFGLMPRWLSWAGLVIAAVCVLSLLAMLWPSVSVLLPLGRFPAYLWLIAAGFALPKTRAALR